MIRLDGRKTLITGGSRGIGRACAVLFAKAGSDVAITYQKREVSALEVKKLVEGLGRECLIARAEMSCEEDIRAVVEKCVKAWGRIDIVVNNAGIWTYGEMGNLPREVWDETMRVNLDSVYYVLNAVVPHMKAHNWGRIINVSSTAGIRGEAFHSHYATSKAALHGLTKSLAVELAPHNILINIVAPGWTETDMCTAVFSDPGYRESVRQSIPLKRIPPPEDMAGPILFFASDLARHITGQILSVNGGSVLCG